MSVNVQALIMAGTAVNPAMRDLWETYQGSVRRSWKEHSQLREALKSATGTVLNVHDLFALPEAWNEDFSPAVAIAPIKERFIRYTNWGEGRHGGFHKSKPIWHSLDEHHFLRIPPPTDKRAEGMADLEVKVPFVPKNLVPWNPLVSRRCYVLFDTPVWTRTQPEDPYLLQRISDSRFRVLAHWDLTDKEKRLMALVS